VLEAGCGVGSQTVLLAANSPDASFVSVDISDASLQQAQEAVRRRDLTNVTFRQGNIFDLSFSDDTFDHVFVCFVLEHLAEPALALNGLKRVLKPGGTITVIEGDHGSFYCYPETPESKAVVGCLIELQARMGGNSLIGRALYPLLAGCGFAEVQVSPRMVYVDSGKPELVEGFSKNTFTAMVEGVRQPALAADMVTPEVWEKGIADLYRATEFDGTFCYTFFKATAKKY
jgi:ubiquinone/menaquinone biosynthesis C-methylase UbiE